MHARNDRHPLRAAGLLVLLFALALPYTAHAAPSDEGQAEPDFRFSAPSMSFGLRLGWINNRADGEIYDFLTDELTLESSDFDNVGVALDLGWRVSDRIDAVVGFEFSGRDRQSEDRDEVDQDGIPIVQETRLTQVPITLSLKFYLSERGQRVGQYAWVPASMVPYVGGGVGATYYRLEQQGEFVDFTDKTIFEAVFESDGWGLSTHAFAGVDVKLTPSLGLVVEGRYQWAEADLTDSFVGFEPIDLNGLRLMGGINFKF